MSEELKKKVVEIIDRHCRYCDWQSHLTANKCIGDKEDQVEEIMSLIKQERIRYGEELAEVTAKLCLNDFDYKVFMVELRQRNKGEI